MTSVLPEFLAIACAFGLGFAAGWAPLRVTPSGGMATCPADGETFDGLVRAADASLYHARNGGRDRVSRPRPLEIPQE